MVIQKILTPVYVYFEMRFIDTLGFLPASLETLTHNLQRIANNTRKTNYFLKYIKTF